MRSLPILFCSISLLPAQVAYVGVTKWPNGARAVVTHSIDDATRFVPATLDAMDRHAIKSTIFVNTGRAEVMTPLWPRLRQAVAAGHELGGHSRSHKCKWPDDESFCAAAFNDDEVKGVRDDILANTSQPHVWAWCYPCGNCAGYAFIHERLKQAGYLVARNYPDEANDGHLVPDMNSWATNPFNAAYSQSVQKKGGIAKNGNTEVARLNAKFDQVLAEGGIYHFMSHPQWLDFGPDDFYERHLAHIGRRPDVWYVPFGQLYAYRELRDKLQVKATGKGRFSVTHPLDPKIYRQAVTLEFRAPRAKSVRVAGNPADFRQENGILRVSLVPPANVEIR